MAFRNGPAEHGEVLRIDIDQAAVDRAAAGDHAVARDGLFGHAEIDTVVLDIHVDFFERAFIQQHGQPLTRGQLALGVLRINALLPSASPGGGAATFHFGDVCGHEIPVSQFEACGMERRAGNVQCEFAKLRSETLQTTTAP